MRNVLKARRSSWSAFVVATFAATARSAPARTNEPDALAEALAALNPDEMSPREALEALYALKAKAGGKGKS